MTHISGQRRGDHVEGANDEEEVPDLVLRRPGLFQGRLHHPLDHAVAEEAEHVVNVREEDAGVLESRGAYSSGAMRTSAA